MIEVPDIQGLVSKRDQALGLKSSLDQQVAELTAELEKLEGDEHLSRACAELLRVLISEEISEGLEAIEALETEGLQKIFPDKKLSCESEVSEKRGKVSVSLMTVDAKPDGSQVRGGSLAAFGGSVSTVESILLRVITMMRYGLKPFLVMDETLAAIAKGYVEHTAEFLRTICERTPGGMDILAITHDPLVIEGAHRAYVIEQDSKGKVRVVQKGA